MQREQQRKDHSVAKRPTELDSLLARLGFKENDPLDATVELVPRSAYDLAINSADSSLGSTPAERANTIASRIAAWSKLASLNTAYV